MDFGTLSLQSWCVSTHFRQPKKVDFFSRISFKEGEVSEIGRECVDHGILECTRYYPTRHFEIFRTIFCTILCIIIGSFERKNKEETCHFWRSIKNMHGSTHIQFRLRKLYHNSSLIRHCPASYPEEKLLHRT